MSNPTSYIIISKSKYVILRAKKTKDNWSLYLDIFFDGKRYYEFLKLYISSNDKRRFNRQDRDNVNIALSVMKTREFEIINNEYKVKSNQSLTDYFRELKEKKVTTKSKWKWMSAYKYFYEYFGNVKFNLKPQELESYKAFLLSKMMQNTAFTYISILSEVFNKAIINNLTNNNPFNQIRLIKKTNSMREFLILDEIKALENTDCDLNIKNAFLFACFTGLRYGDIIKISWDMLRLNEKALYYKMNKNQKSEFLFLPEQALKYLPDKTSEFIFNIPNLKLVNKQLKIWYQSAGIKKHVTFHIARHTFATLALTYGVEIKTLSEMMGHSDVKTTQIYAKIIDEKKKEAASKFPTL